jgi:hypothetical protein
MLAISLMILPTNVANVNSTLKAFLVVNETGLMKLTHTYIKEKNLRDKKI